ncbi:phosphate ABC transporter ATP-binding protein [Nitrosococcus wardiae]|uniref:Phosphate ABC transporter ATP-binding protein n=1 Tax=Nitrosococcus wardiae TaxID=1814290 RepID=A0A4P7C456_9GAMM|nr:phosphate ABC transporter ATP-binding protein [Nitrosococcus wardiae]
MGSASPKTAQQAQPANIIEPFLEVKSLSVYYGPKPALKDVAFAIPKGGITALIGPSGCGKTSFLNSLNRITDLIPGCQVKGYVRFGHSDVYAPTTDLLTLRRRIGMIFQKPNPFPLSIVKNMELPLKEHGITQRRQREEKIEKVLKEVGLWEEVKDQLNTPAHSLSGGQQQRLCIARALALQPEILLMDEPCSALDPFSSQIVEDQIVELGRQMTILIVTHNLAQARRIADNIALFWVQEGAGRLIEMNNAAKLFNSPKNPITASYISGAKG